MIDYQALTIWNLMVLMHVPLFVKASRNLQKQSRSHLVRAVEM
jgi:hypothetical protein